MVLDSFKEKFNKLIDILTTDEKIAKEFSSIDTVDESFDFACRLVGEMDRNKYHRAVKEYIENLESDQESIFDNSFENSIHCYETDTNSDTDTNSSNRDQDNESNISFKKSSLDYNSHHYGYKKLSPYDEKKISGGVLFRHRKMHI